MSAAGALAGAREVMRSAGVLAGAREVLPASVGLSACYYAPPTTPAVVAAVWEKDAITLTRATPGGPPALAVSSRLPRFEEQYTLRIALR